LLFFLLTIWVLADILYLISASIVVTLLFVLQIG